MPDDRRDSRLLRILGPERVARLAASRVLVCGLGGVGSNCLEALARGGVGSFVLIDGDAVAVSNINRQAIAYTRTIGMRKVDAAEALVREINPDARISKIDAFVLPETIDEVLADVDPGSLDYAVDAIDTVAAKLALALWSQRGGVPHIASMGGGNKLFPERLRFADIYDTSGDPLCRSVRKQARKLGIERLEVLYSPEAPVPVAHEEGARWQERTNLGTMSYFPPIMGQMIAGRVIRDLAGIGADGLR